MLENQSSPIATVRYIGGSHTPEFPASDLKDLTEFTRYLELQKLRFFERDSFLWVQKRPGFLDSFPPHRRARLQSREAAKFFARGIAAIRYTCDDGYGSSSFAYIWDDKNFNLESLHKSSRRNVRRGLAACEVERIDFELLAREGCAINRSVFARHRRWMDSVLTEEPRWKKYIRAFKDFPFFEAYGIFIEGRLRAFCLAHLIDDYCYLVHPHATTEYLDRCPVHALVYRIVNGMLSRPGVRCVSAGLEPFYPRPTVERFKLAMGCRKVSISREVLVNPMARPFFSGMGLAITETILKRFKPQLLDDYLAFSGYLGRRGGLGEPNQMMGCKPTDDPKQNGDAPLEFVEVNQGEHF